MKLCPFCDTEYPNHHTNCDKDGAVRIACTQLDPGTIIRGKYRIVRALGRGGMGTVYLAEHTLLGRQQALKFISSEMSRDPRFLKRFRLEALAAIELRHPNVVEVFDLDLAEDGSPYIAMEYVNGQGLREALAAGPFALERALEIASGVALGLETGSFRGHCSSGCETGEHHARPGARRARNAENPGFRHCGDERELDAVSRTRGLLLTPEYAAPEQWKGMAGEELDGRVDLYALGGVLYEMLTGRTSFHAHNTEGWMYQHLQERPAAPSSLRPELAQWSGLDAIMLQLLSKDREERPANVSEFVRELQALTRRSGATQWEGAGKTVVEVRRVGEADAVGKTKSQGAGVGSNPQPVALAELESAGGTRPKARRLPVFLFAGGPILAGIAAWAYFHAQRSTLLRDPPPIITKTIEKLPASRPPAINLVKNQIRVSNHSPKRPV